ncbi:MAG: DUF3035 domain-containing protein [Geminicoccaceae bacterium]
MSVPFGPRLACGLIIASMLAACSGQRTVAERIGIGNRPPDEFQVRRTQPLIVPPELALPAPGEPTAASAAGSSSDQARRTLIAGSPDASGAEGALPEGAAAGTQVAALSQGEQALVSQARVTGPVDADIRAQLVQEDVDIQRFEPWILGDVFGVYQEQPLEARPRTALRTGDAPNAQQRTQVAQSDADSQVLDAASEAERLERAARTGESAAEGLPVPTLDRRGQVPLGGG